MKILEWPIETFKNIKESVMDLIEGPSFRDLHNELFGIEMERELVKDLATRKLDLIKKQAALIILNQEVLDSITYTIQLPQK